MTTLDRSAMILLLLTACVCVEADAQGPKKIFPPHEEPNTQTVFSPGTAFTPVAHMPMHIDSLTYQVATTYYDYLFNSGGPCHVVWYQGRTYLIWIGKDSPIDPRSIYYTSFDGTAWLPPQPAVSPTVQSTYFSGIDVWRGGVRNGRAVIACGWAGSGVSYFATEAAPGQGNFSSVIVSPNRDTQCLTLDSTGTVLFEDSKGRTDYALRKSTDFGTTWVSLDTGLIASLHSTGALDAALLQGSLEPNLVKAPDGDIYIGTTLSGYGGVPPTDTVTNPDRADQWGYFKSTNGGGSWTWTRILADGA